MHEQMRKAVWNGRILLAPGSRHIWVAASLIFLAKMIR
jgi:hypothetical protein